MKAWLFGKGASFTEDFDWSRVGDDFRVGITQASQYVKDIDLAITYDPRIKEIILNEYKIPVEKTITERNPDWPRPVGSGDYAFIVLGELGFKRIHCVGMDGTFKNHWPNGRDYPAIGEDGDDRIKTKIQKTIQDRIKYYGMNVTTE